VPATHLHLRINARVFAVGKWRGLHTIGVGDSIDAINGIGHAAMMTDPQFRSALAAHGFTLDLATGEAPELAEFSGAFSARARQIGRNIDRYEAEWRDTHLDRHTGRSCGGVGRSCVGGGSTRQAEPPRRRRPDGPLGP
jgi:exodeoxyribonuclease V alpha subunit